MYFEILVSLILLTFSNGAPTGAHGPDTALLATTTSPTWIDSSLAVPTAEPTQEHPPLLPAIHWDHAGNDLQHLAPQSEHRLYFSSQGVSDPGLEHAFAHFNATWEKSVVILDHSNLIRSVGCAVGGIAVEFATTKAYEYAQETWPSDDDFMLATYTEGCGQQENVRSFWQVSDLTYFSNEMTILATVQEELGMESVLGGASMVWGTWKPNVSKSHSSTSPRRRAADRCGAAPHPKIDGFPAVACNDPNFDETLDAEIGYLDFQESHYSNSFQKFVPGASNDTDPDPGMPDAPDLSRRALRHMKSSLNRRLIKRNFWEGIGQTIKGGFEKFGGLLSGNKELQNQGDKNIVEGKDKLKIVPKVNLNIPIDVSAPKDKLVQEPWPNSFSIAKKEGEAGGVKGTVEVFCVDCHAKGKVDLGGSAEWHLTEGLKKLEGNIKGNLEAQIALGIVAEVTKEDKFEQELARLTPPGFAIPKIFEIGPFIALRATAEVNLSLKGQALAGVKLTIPEFEGSVNLKEPEKSKKLDLQPKLEKIFEAKATISATAGIGLPVAIGFGISIPPLKFKKDLELVEKPMVEANIKAEISTDGSTTDAKCKGLDWNIIFKNTVYFDAAGFKQFTINEFSKDLAKGCFEIPGISGGTTTTTGDTTTATGDTTTATGDATTATGDTTTATGDSTPTTTAETTAATDTATAAKRHAGVMPTLVARSNSTSNSTWLPYDESDYSFIEDNENDFTDHEENVEFKHLANESEQDSRNDTSGNAFEEGDRFISIKSVNGNLQLSLDNDGNIRPYSSKYRGIRWTENEGLVFADESTRILHYHPDTMNKLGVSRIRGSSDDKIPKTADLVVLHPAQTGDTNTPYVYMAADSQGNAFHLLTCAYNRGPSKLFLAKAVEQGIEKLKEENLRYIVTGGVVEECVEYPWVVPAGAEGPE